MKYALSITEAAETDLRTAFIWYEEQKEDLGLLFEKHINKAFHNIQQNPLNFQFRYNQTRVAFLKKFPYGIHFNVVGREIIIHAVFHTSQNPLKWENRK